MSKIFVLDTNVLIHDPEAIFKFEEHQVIIPMTVVEELDSLKERKGEVSTEARAASRNLKKALIEMPKKVVVSSHVGVGAKESLDLSVPDNRILATALYHHKMEPDYVVLVSKDNNVWIKGKGLGICVEDYTNDRVDRGIQPTVISTNILASDVPYTTSEAGIHYKVGDFEDFTGKDPSFVHHIMDCGNVYPLHVVEDIVTIPYPLIAVKETFGISPRNDEQKMAMAALQDDTDFVCLEGPAGSGKTLLALAYGLAQVIEEKRYKSIVVLRSSNSDHIGHLPGTEEEKMMPWMQGFVDNLEVLVGSGDEKQDSMTIEMIMSQARIKFRSLDLVRGRSYQDTLVIVDEAQNNTRHQLKAILTRVGEGSKLIMLGNLAQIDTPYLNEQTSGLKHVCTRMAGFEHGAICVFKDVHRSRLTAYAEEHM